MPFCHPYVGSYPSGNPTEWPPRSLENTPMGAKERGKLSRLWMTWDRLRMERGLCGWMNRARVVTVQNIPEVCTDAQSSRLWGVVETGSGSDTDNQHWSCAGAAAVLAPGHSPHPVQTQALVQAARLKGKNKEFFPRETEMSRVVLLPRIGPIPPGMWAHSMSCLLAWAHIITVCSGRGHCQRDQVRPLQARRREESECPQQGEWREGRIHRKADPEEWIILQQKSSFIKVLSLYFQSYSGRCDKHIKREYCNKGNF